MNSISPTRRIHIRKEDLKFSSAHMTVYPDGSKECLHGHNYVTDITFDLSSVELAKMIPFSVLKAAVATICRQWDERLLIPQECPYLRIISDTSHEIEFILCKKRYVLPRDEVVLLPVDNIAVEALSELFFKKLLQALDSHAFFSVVQSLHVRIEEAPGQGATFSKVLV